MAETIAVFDSNGATPPERYVVVFGPQARPPSQGGGTGGVVNETAATVTPVAGALTLDLDASRNFLVPEGDSIDTLAFTNVPAAGTACTVKLVVEQAVPPRLVPAPSTGEVQVIRGAIEEPIPSAVGSPFIAEAPPIAMGAPSVTPVDATFPTEAVGNAGDASQCAWWKFRAPADMLADFSLAGSTATNTVLAIYVAAGEPATLADLELWYDSQSATPDGQGVATAVEAYGGTTYWIQAGQLDPPVDNSYTLTVTLSDANLTPVQIDRQMRDPQINPADTSLFAGIVTGLDAGGPDDQVANGVWVGRRTGAELVEVGSWIAPTPSPWNTVDDVHWLSADTLMFRCAPDAAFGDPYSRIFKLALARVTDAGVAFSTPVTIAWPDGVEHDNTNYAARHLSDPLVTIGEGSVATMLFAGEGGELSKFTFDFSTGEPTNLQFVDLAHTASGVHVWSSLLLTPNEYLVHLGGKTVYRLHADGSTGPEVDLGALFDSINAVGTEVWTGVGLEVSGEIHGQVVDESYWAPAVIYVAGDVPSEAAWVKADLVTGVTTTIPLGLLGSVPSAGGNPIFPSRAAPLSDGQMWASFLRAGPAPDETEWRTRHWYATVDTTTEETTVQIVLNGLNTYRLDGTPVGTVGDYQGLVHTRNGSDANAFFPLSAVPDTVCTYYTVDGGATWYVSVEPILEAADAAPAGEPEVATTYTVRSTYYSTDTVEVTFSGVGAEPFGEIAIESEPTPGVLVPATSLFTTPTAGFAAPGLYMVGSDAAYSFDGTELGDVTLRSRIEVVYQDTESSQLSVWTLLRDVNLSEAEVARLISEGLSADWEGMATLVPVPVADAYFSVSTELVLADGSTPAATGFTSAWIAVTPVTLPSP